MINFKTKAMFSYFRNKNDKKMNFKHMLSIIKGNEADDDINTHVEK